jgi:hypothetical protein
MFDQRAAILAAGLLASFNDRDSFGRIALRYGAALVAHDRVFVCEEKSGQPELEVEVEIDAQGQRWGRPTGVTRPCAVGRDD